MRSSWEELVAMKFEGFRYTFCEGGSGSTEGILGGITIEEGSITVRDGAGRYIGGCSPSWGKWCLLPGGWVAVMIPLVGIFYIKPA